MRTSRWTVAGKPLPSATIVAQKVQHAGHRIQGLPYAGLLGSDVLSTFGTIRLDFTAKTLTLHATGKPAGKWVPLTVRRGHGQVIPVATIDVGGTRTQWIFDTGAASNSIDQAGRRAAQAARRRQAAHDQRRVL